MLSTGLEWWRNMRTERDVARWFHHVQVVYGVENAFTGEAFDEASGRPLHHKHGTGIYVRLDPERS